MSYLSELFFYFSCFYVFNSGMWNHDTFAGKGGTSLAIHLMLNCIGLDFLLG